MFRVTKPVSCSRDKFLNANARQLHKTGLLPDGTIQARIAPELSTVAAGPASSFICADKVFTEPAPNSPRFFHVERRKQQKDFPNEPEVC